MPSRRTVYSLTRTRPDRSLSDARSTGKLTRTVLPQANAYATIRRARRQLASPPSSGNHSFRATGITAYLKNGGTLEKAAAMANHTSTRTTQLHDRRRDEVSLDKV
jgi:integrase